MTKIGFTDAVKLVYSRYVDFKGRSPRAEYWWFQLYFFVVLFVLSFATAGLGETVSGAVLGLFYLAHIIPLIALTVRRLHDTDRSGWWILLALVPLVSLVLLVFTILEGTKGPNRFGPDPYGRGMAETFD